MDNHTTPHDEALDEALDEAQRLLYWADKVAEATHELVRLTARGMESDETLGRLCNLKEDVKLGQQTTQWMAIDTATEYLGRAKVKSTCPRVRQVLLKFEVVVDNYREALTALALAGAAAKNSKD
jgi:hypothetical protein